MNTDVVYHEGPKPPRPSVSPASGYLIAFDPDGKDYRFVGSSDKDDLRETTARQFVTMTTGELEKLLGHAVQHDADGLPTGLAEKDHELIGATMAVYHAVGNNPNLDDDAKRRIFLRIKEGLANGDSIEVLAEAAVDAALAKKEIEDRLRGAPPRARRAILKAMRAESHKKRRHLAEKGRFLAERKQWVTGVQAAYDDILPWLERPLVLQTPPATMFFHVREAARDEEMLWAVDLTRELERPDPAYGRDFEEAFGDASVFVVEHDWAAAFAGAQDYVGGELRLPDEACVFEFRISGRHVIATVAEVDGRLHLSPIIHTGGRWFVPPNVYVMDDSGRWSGLSPAGNDSAVKLVELIAAQVRAVAIALDAEVATTEVVRAPHKLNHARERRGHLPMNSYHVVSLARRARARALERDPNAEPGTRRRLHFRRGHWRHYPDHKTWIKWMLVGNPDLGFVDKHYKL